MRMKHIKRGAVGTLLIFLLSTVLPALNVKGNENDISDDYVNIIIEYEDYIPEDSNNDPSYKNVKTLENLLIKTMSVPSSSLREISLSKNVRRITYDQEMTTSESYAPLSEDDWNQDAIGTFDAWNEGLTGDGVKVAVLDTGFYKHPEITYKDGYSIFDETHELGVDEWTNDHSGHGTHVAGIIGAHQGTRAQGVAPGVDLYGVKIYHEDNRNKTSAANLLNGINWAISQKVDIITLSSGYQGFNSAVHKIISDNNITYNEEFIDGVNKDILFIAASGNYSNGWDTIDFPAAHEEVVAVANVNRDLISDRDSKKGSTIDDFKYENDLSAPGKNILSLGLNNSHTVMSGTSQSAPHVAGIAALLMEKYPQKTAYEIQKLMEEQALDLGEPGHDDNYGHGLVQYEAQAAEAPDQTDEEPSEEETDLPEEETPEDGSDTSEETDETDGADDAEEETDSGSEEDALSEGETGSEEIDGSQREDSTEDPAPEETADEESSETDEAAEEEPADSDDTEQEEETDEDEPADSTNDEATAEDSEETEEPAPQRTVWIRPSETNGVATIAEEDIQAVAENGVLAVSFDASLGHIDRISLSSDQIQTLKEKNVALLVARVDLEWVIPTSNLSEGNALLTFEPTRQAVTFEEITKGKILTFGIEQEGQQLASFPSHMTYRFFTPAAEYNQDNLYQWNETDESWELLGDAYTKGGVVGVTTETPTLAVFNPEELASARADAEAEKEEPAVSEPEQPETEPVETEEEDESAFLDGNSSGLPVVLSSVVVVILSVSGGFYFFGGKAK